MRCSRKEPPRGPLSMRHACQTLRFHVLPDGRYPGAPRGVRGIRRRRSRHRDITTSWIIRMRNTHHGHPDGLRQPRTCVARYPSSWTNQMNGSPTAHAINIPDHPDAQHHHHGHPDGLRQPRTCVARYPSPWTDRMNGSPYDTSQHHGTP